MAEIPPYVDLDDLLLCQVCDYWDLRDSTTATADGLIPSHEPEYDDLRLPYDGVRFDHGSERSESVVLNPHMTPLCRGSDRDPLDPSHGWATAPDVKKSSGVKVRRTISALVRYIDQELYGAGQYRGDANMIKCYACPHSKLSHFAKQYREWNSRQLRWEWRVSIKCEYDSDGVDSICDCETKLPLEFMQHCYDFVADSPYAAYEDGTAGKAAS